MLGSWRQASTTRLAWGCSPQRQQDWAGGKGHAVIQWLDPRGMSLSLPQSCPCHRARLC